MERLTEKRDGQNVIPLRQNGEVKWALSSAGMGDAPTRFLYGVHADKLAEYEDLEERIYKIYGECDGPLETVVEHLERHENIDIPEPVFKARLLTDGAVDRWEEYKALEKQGKLLKLPVLVGGTVWDNDFGQPYSYTVTGFSFCKIDDDEENDIEGLQMYYRNYNGSICCSCAVSEIGKTVFLTKEEAEAALKKMEESK